MNHEPLGKHAELIRGITFKPTDKIDVGDKDAVVCMRTKNVQVALDESDLIAIPRLLAGGEKKMLRRGDILVSSANSWNLVGKCCPVPKLAYPATAGGFISILRPTNGKLDASYLYRWFSSGDVQATVRSLGNQTTNISNLSHKRTMQLEIPLPPLAEQKRIAGILDAADALRAKRREALAQLDTLLQATFLDLFGDPVTNPKGWEVKSMGQLFELKHGFAFKSEYFVDKGEYVLLTPGNFFEEGGFRDRGDKQRYYDEHVEAEYVLNEGDLLVAMTEQAPGLLGSPVLIPKSGTFLHNQRLGKVVKKAEVESRYIFALMNAASIRARIQQDSQGTKVKHTSPKKIAAIGIGVPPLALQRRFTRFVESAERQKSEHQKHLAELDTLFASLQSRAFKGEL